jgi:hypothetical protein
MLLLCGGFLAGLVSCVKRPALVPLTNSNSLTDAVVIRETGRSSTDSLDEEESATRSFRFPDDRGGRLLADLLPPSEKLPRLPSDRPSGPLHFPTPPTLERMELPLPSNQAVLPPSLLGVKSRPIRPQALPLEPPLADYWGDPLVPRRPEFYAGERIRLPSADLNQPIPLPTLAQKQAEPMSSDDPTGEVSLAGALAASAPERATPAPFLRLVVPDPFEHRHTVRLRAELLEDPTPTTSSPRLPGR